MTMKADLTQREVDPPFNHWCSCGHAAPLFFKRSGPNSTPEPTRFFQVDGPNISGIYCEPCLIIANFASFQNKKR